MADDPIKNEIFTSEIEERLKGKIKTDLKTSFDYKSLLQQIGLHVDIPPAELLTTSVRESEGSYISEITDAEEKAALSGKFVPGDLFLKKISADKKIKILSPLAVNCTIYTVRTLKWQLNSNRRKEVLSRLIESGRLAGKLLSQLPPTDLFGTILRRVLIEQNNLQLDKLNQKEIIQLVNILESIQGINLPLPSIADVRSLVRTAGMMDRYAIITEGFTGRDAELNQLNSFLKASKSKSNSSGWKGLVMSGMGGAGKSTLLAKFAGDVLEKKLARVAILDFDRPGINVKNEQWLNEEIARQIGIGETEVLHRPDSNHYTDRTNAFAMFLSARFLDKTPFLLILDTVEEVSQNDQVDELIDWIHSLNSYFSHTSFRVIFSGRLFDDQLKKFLRVSSINKNPITINEFEPEIAGNFLLKQGLSKRMSDNIINSGLLPLRPLELKLLSTALKEGSLSFSDFKKELGAGSKKKKSKDLVAGIIYRRVLLRISDPQVRSIAYPGLVLRYITPQIVQHVLQPALGLKPMSDSEADSIVKKLSKFSWLAYTDKGKVWHSKELRRSMLRLMIAGEPQKTKKIRAQAIKYFDTLKDETSAAESVYHKLMKVEKPEDGKKITLQSLKNTYSRIYMDMADFSKPANVLLRYGAKKPVHNSELYLLPADYFDDIYHSMGRRLLSQRKFNDAFELYKKGKKRKRFEVFGRKDDFLDNWEYETMFCTANFSELSKNTRFVPNDGRPTLATLINYMFPLALVDVSKIDRSYIESMLLDIVSHSRSYDFYGLRSNRATAIYRLSVCFTCIHASIPLSLQTKDYIMNLIEQLRWKKGSDPLVDKSLHILSIICTGKPDSQYELTISLIRLQPHWFDRIRPWIPETVKRWWKEMHHLLRKPVDAPISSKQLIGYLDVKLGQKYRIKIPTRLIRKGGMYEFLRGPAPVFRDPCHYAILDAFKTPKDIELLVGLMAKVISYPLTDLNPPKLKTLMHDNRELALEPFIEIIDRTWAIGTFLELALKAKPKSQKIRDVLKAYEAWKQAHHRLLIKI